MIPSPRGAITKHICFLLEQIETYETDQWSEWYALNGGGRTHTHSLLISFDSSYSRESTTATSHRTYLPHWSIIPFHKTDTIFYNTYNTAAFRLKELSDSHHVNLQRLAGVQLPSDHITKTPKTETHLVGLSETLLLRLMGLTSEKFQALQGYISVQKWCTLWISSWSNYSNQYEKTIVVLGKKPWL